MINRTRLLSSGLLSSGLSFAAAAACMLHAPAALAQSADSAEADRLFTEAKTLAEGGQYAQACPKLERSLQLDPAIGTEFNLADCFEHVGRNANAYRHYRAVEKAYHAAGKSEREAAAKARLDVLKPKLGWLKVEPAPGSAIGQLSVDGESLPPSAASEYPEGLPLDPGSRSITASSTAKDNWAQTVDVSATGTVTVHPFKEAMERRSRATGSDGRGNTQRTIAVAVGAVGAAGLIVGGVTGILAITTHNDAVDQGKLVGCGEPGQICRDVAGQPARAEDAAGAWTRATTFGNVSTVGFIAGGVLAATAIVLYVTAPKSRPLSPTTATRWDLQGLHF